MAILELAEAAAAMGCELVAFGDVPACQAFPFMDGEDDVCTLEASAANVRVGTLTLLCAGATPTDTPIGCAKVMLVLVTRRRLLSGDDRGECTDAPGTLEPCCCASLDERTRFSSASTAFVANKLRIASGS